MDDRDFFDHLFQQFAKTTGAENTYWMTDQEGDTRWNIAAVDQTQKKTLIATYLREADADFITAVHGCLPDLVRRLHDALDEADRLDRERDEAEQNVFQLAVRNDELLQEVHSLRQGLAIAEGKLATAASRAGDTLWKIERPM